MLSRAIIRLTAVALTFLASASRAQGPAPGPPPAAPPEDAGAEVAPGDFVYTPDEAIDILRARILRDPRNFAAHRQLGELYERKAERTGDLACYEKAEAALRRSLELFPDAPRTQVSLAAVLCSRHKFAEGLELARKALKARPKDVDALATTGDALLEMGQYAEAEAVYRDLERVSKLPPVLSRLANLADLKGNPDEAIRLMARAADEVVKDGGSAKEAGWFLARLGEIALNAGRVDDAERRYAAVPPGIDAYHDATAGLGRIRAMQGRLDEAIDLYRKAVALGPDPHMLAALGDLYLLAGKPELAGPLFDRLLKATEGKGEYLRVRAMFLANHDRDLPQALALAEKDLEQRKDVYGYDALAWTLSKNGRLADAAQAAEQALRLGTQDPLLFFHAGMIRHRLGERDRARALLAKALALNPRFDPRLAAEARQALDDLSKPG